MSIRPGAPAPLLLASLPALLAGCGASDAGDPPATGRAVRDSAGVEIVSSDAPRWADGGGWTVAPEADAVLAGHGDADFALFRAVDLALLPHGAVAVANSGTAEVAVLEADGALRARLGGRGEGPGEFQWLNGVLARGDSVVAVDGATLRFSVFGPDGDLAREFSVEPEPGHPTGIRAVAMGEAGVGVFREVGFAEKLAPGVLRLPGSAFRLDWGGTRAVDFPGSFPGGAIFVLTDGMGTLPLGPDLFLAGDADGFHVGDGERAEVRAYAPDGRLARLVRWATVPRPVSEAMRAEWTEAQSASMREQGMPEEAVAKQRQFQERVPFPEHLPVHRDLVVDEGGHLWVRRYRTGLSSDTPTSWQGKTVGPDAPLAERPSDWWVFAPDGEWLGSVTTPPGLRVEVVTTDAVWGVHTDALGVETVRRHALAR